MSDFGQRHKLYYDALFSTFHPFTQAMKRASPAGLAAQIALQHTSVLKMALTKTEVPHYETAPNGPIDF
jgi:hypothetical protein